MTFFLRYSLYIHVFASVAAILRCSQLLSQGCAIFSLLSLWLPTFDIKHNLLGQRMKLKELEPGHNLGSVLDPGSVRMAQRWSFFVRS